MRKYAVDGGGAKARSKKNEIWCSFSVLTLYQEMKKKSDVRRIYVSLTFSNTSRIFPISLLSLIIAFYTYQKS